LNATYYGQRASKGGLLITEATQISPLGKGYPGAPGIHSQAQVEGWKLVTDAVHAKGGYIFLQLWHVGRMSHSSLHPKEGLPVSASAVAPQDGSKAMTAEFKQVPFETPRALDLSELPGIVEQYRLCALNAKAAGFDGVEIHGANGYLLDQFLEDKTNHRTDAYGGSIENRARLLTEVADAVVSVWGGDRVGVRLSPYGKFLDMGDSNPVALFNYVLQQLSKMGVAYAHVIETRSGEKATGEEPRTSELFRKMFTGAFISAGGYDGESADKTVAEGFADAIAFGRWFISNPDLPKRLELGGELNQYDRSTFYGGAEKGYTDYPAIG